MGPCERNFFGEHQIVSSFLRGFEALSYIKSEICFEWVRERDYGYLPEDWALRIYSFT